MYGKVFASCFTGSMYGSGPTVFALWAYAIANADRVGDVELNPTMLAAVIGTSVEDIQAALDSLMAPDPNSRNQSQEGRRLLRQGQFAYNVVSYPEYRKIRDAEDRREYQRSWISDKRRQVSTMSTHADAEVEVEAKTTTLSKSVKKPTASDDSFDLLWTACAKKVGKGAARKAWDKARKEHRLPSPELVVSKLSALQETDDWRKDGRKYQPHLATWLNRDGWEDEAQDSEPDSEDFHERFARALDKKGIPKNQIFDFDGTLIASVQ